MATDQPEVLRQQLEHDRICDEFELAWQHWLTRSDPSAPPPRLEEYLARTSSDSVELLLRELLSVELAYRIDHGDRPSEQEYRTRLPDHPNALLEAFARFPKLAAIKAAETARPLASIGRYTILSTIGAGAFGTVYRAKDDILLREVAVKVSHQHCTSEQHRHTYLNEARILASLKHPHIVPVYDVGDEKGTFYIVSQLIRGSSLAEFLSGHQFDFRTAAESIAKLAGALHYAHTQQLVHRDVKPANILLDEQHEPYLTDFGLALTESDYGRPDRQGGTVAYMSPEQARGESHRVDGRSDIFSLGAVFYEMLTGVRPFRGQRRSEIVDQILHIDVKPPRMLNDRIPKELERICMKTLARRATDRYAVAQDLVDDLNDYLVSGSVSQADSTPVGIPDAQQIGQSTRVIPKGLRSFDSEDADFFLRLVPGPRDRHGLPDVIRFWKTRIESDSEQAFGVGLVYGPSGCGKSSLVKAGLLPQLADHVTPIYIECSAADTEKRICRALQSVWPDAPSGANLPQLIAALRKRSEVVSRRKYLLILDQFEQWLQSQQGQFDGELTDALRQCCGDKVQALLLARDDFWLALSRLFDQLEVDLLEGQNTTLIDLFDYRHARQVLIEFGQAYGCLPQDAAQLSKENERFLDQVISELSQEGKVISVRISLFADMVKARPWIPETLSQAQGTEGIGVQFLDATFGAMGNPAHRKHHEAARRVLRAIVPQDGSVLRGQVKSAAELRRVSGYADRPREFHELMHILDSETRLLTAVDTEQISSVPNSDTASDAPYYQLTHDYLVQSLQQWLTREQRETRRGRAELRLSERAAAFAQHPESKQLPTLWEYLAIRLWTSPRNWTPPQRHMMRKADRLFGVRGLVAAMLIGFMLIIGWKRYSDSKTEQVQSLVEQLEKANSDEIPSLILEKLKPLGSIAKHEVNKHFNEETVIARKQILELAGKVLAPPITEKDWERLVNDLLREPSGPAEQQWRMVEFRTLLGEAGLKFTPANLVSLLQVETAEQFRLVFSQLKQLTDDNPETRRVVVQSCSECLKNGNASCRANYAVALIFLGEAEAEEVWDYLQKQRKAEPKDADIHAVRAYIIHRLKSYGGSAESKVVNYLLDRLKATTKDSATGPDDSYIRKTLVLALGEFHDALSPEDPDRQQLIAELYEIYKTDGDAGVHSAAEWALLKFGQSKTIEDFKKENSEKAYLQRPLIGRKWTVNSQLQTEVILLVGVDSKLSVVTTEVTKRQYAADFHGQLPELEPPNFVDPCPDDDCPIVGVSWFEAAAYCNWLSQQEGFPPEEWCYEFPGFSSADLLYIAISRDDSRQKEFWKDKEVRLANNWRNRKGYRLPTLTEWNTICSAGGANTDPSFGELGLVTDGDNQKLEAIIWNPDCLLRKYAGIDLLQEATGPVMELKPNDWGVFGLYGGAGEWCQNAATEESDDQISDFIDPATERRLRGGSYSTPPREMTFRKEGTDMPDKSNDHKDGFRVVRRLID